MRLLPYGDRAVLAEVPDSATVLAVHAALRRLALPGVVELVPAARTVLVQFDLDRIDRVRLSTIMEDLDLSSSDTVFGEDVRLPVRYDGADLASVAEAADCTVADVIRRHSSPEYTVAFCGFAPGFSYLTGLDRRLHLPRLATPRTQVPAGSVAIAGEYTGVYPSSSPGGWRLIGRTPLTLWRPEEDQPATLVPGTRVRFVEAGP
jgi:KipI family sensor histidine kinase inhibitor